uniref:Uncharacterized protein n=1 Tax=Stigeoclonium helveticum TaxID=55999 RepID=A0A6M4SR93_STIHE|nr:hypothetical protein [Stigeoclonium helveticum]
MEKYKFNNKNLNPLLNISTQTYLLLKKPILNMLNSHLIDFLSNFRNMCSKNNNDIVICEHKLAYINENYSPYIWEYWWEHESLIFDSYYSNEGDFKVDLKDDHYKKYLEYIELLDFEKNEYVAARGHSLVCHCCGTELDKCTFGHYYLDSDFDYD